MEAFSWRRESKGRDFDLAAGMQLFLRQFIKKGGRAKPYTRALSIDASYWLGTAPYGIEMYYLNVMAGPRRNWRFRNHPDFDWIAQKDA